VEVSCAQAPIDVNIRTAERIDFRADKGWSALILIILFSMFMLLICVAESGIELADPLLLSCMREAITM
jgi:hypothetical protein